MEHLMDAIDRRLTELGLTPICGVVNNREQCTRYISRILEDHGNKVAIPFQDTLEQYDFRVKHVLFSFGLGIVLAPFCHLEDRIQAACRREAPPSFLYVWLTVCLYHDFGYFIAPACRSAASLEALDLAHPIFDAGYCESRYSRRLYEAYYREKYARHGPDSEEVGDHGILGAACSSTGCGKREIPTGAPSIRTSAGGSWSTTSGNGSSPSRRRIPFPRSTRTTSAPSACPSRCCTCCLWWIRWR